MQYQRGKPKLNLLLKQILFVTALLFTTSTLFSQIRSTIQLKKTEDIQQVKTGIITNENVLKTDTALTGKINDNKVINVITPAKDINIRPIQISYPDSILMGEYTIVVENYDKGGEWNQKSLIHNHLNGTGRVKLSCPVSFTIIPGLWKDAVLKPVYFKVVDNVSTKENEISIADAVTLGLEATPGKEVELMMPQVNGKAINKADYIKDLGRIKKPEGILVRFIDLSVKVTNLKATKGEAISGTATYPSDPSLETVPFRLNIHPGFQLEVSKITFTPLMDPLVSANLLLPTSLVQNSICSRGSINLGNFRISPQCEFYKEFPSDNYGIFGVGNSTLAIDGKGFVADFSSTQTYSPIGKPANWKGVVLMQGESKGSPSGSTISNIGYLQGRYNFTNGTIESSGLAASFDLAVPYSFETTQPYGYVIDMNTASLNVSSSKITDGSIRNGTITLPKTSVLQFDNSPVRLSDLSLNLNSSLNLTGSAIIKPEMTVYWGDLITAGGGNRKSFGASNFTRQVRIFFASQPRPIFDPTTADGKSFYFPYNYITADIADSLNMQGATFGSFTVFVVNTPDIPSASSWNPDRPEPVPTDNKVWYRFNGKNNCWINVVTEGVNCNIDGKMQESPNLKLGNELNPQYVGEKPFEVKTNNDKQSSSLQLQCVESAVLKCDYHSFVDIPEPTNTVMEFKEMVFTSTANNAGGKLVVQSNDSLSYWGLALVPKPGFSSAGLVCVKTGQIIVTAAGLSEKKHFAQPFWLTWGEMLANGSMGRLFFDFNSAGQQFDHFNYIHNAVALSVVNPDPAKKGFLRVGGTAFFPFFGGDYLHITDTYRPDKPDQPFFKREIKLSDETLTGFQPSDLNIGGNWSDGLGIFNFDIKYADVTQDGFMGEGISTLRNLVGGEMRSTLDMNSRGTCIRLGTNLLDQRSISLGPVANVSDITRIWGCVCFNGDGIENIVLGGEVTNSLNASVVIRSATSLIAMLQITPSLCKLTMDGEAYMSIMASLDALVTGHLQLTLNNAEDFVEGEVAGKIRVAEGAILVGSSIEAQGQLNWHLGLDFNELQGMVALDVMGFGGGSGVGAGFYVGVNAPKNRAWVLIGANPRYALNMTPMPARLTGVYGFINVHEGINLYIVSGGYDVYLGLGAFLNAGLVPYVVGNLGGRIYGDILGGLVSAAAYFNMQLLLGYPLGFQGTVGLEACVLWVACGSVDLTVGLNSSEGFYIR